MSGLCDEGVEALSRLTGLVELSVVAPHNKGLTQSSLALLAPLRSLRYSELLCLKFSDQSLLFIRLCSPCCCALYRLKDSLQDSSKHVAAAAPVCLNLACVLLQVSYVAKRRPDSSGSRCGSLPALHLAAAAEAVMHARHAAACVRLQRPGGAAAAHALLQPQPDLLSGLLVC